MGKRLISINARQRSIIFALLTAENRLTLKTLAKLTGLTPRTVRYNLNAVSTWFRNENVKLIARSGYGIDLDTDQPTKKKLLQFLSQAGECDLILTRGQRQRLILFRLLTIDTPATYQFLASIEGVSRSTIVSDVNDIQHWLDDFGLILRRTQNKGVSITGHELSKRLALVNLIREELGEEKWFSLWFNSKLENYSDKALPPDLESFIRKIPLQECRNTIRHIENLIGDKLALYSRLELAVYLAVSITAMKAGNFAVNSKNNELDNIIQLEISRIIISEIERTYHLEIPEIEIRLLAICILGSKWEDDEQNHGSLTSSDNLDYLGEECLDYAKEIIAVCSNQLHPLLRVDQELAFGLAKHLKPVINRIRFHLPILNDSLDSIKQSYPDVYRSAASGLETLSKNLGKPIPEGEIGFITMYLAAALIRLQTKDRTNQTVVIIGDGIRAKTSILKARLEFEFPDLVVIGVMSGRLNNDKVIHQADLVLSLIPIEIPGVTTIHVSPFLDNKERRIIQNWQTEKEEKYRKLQVVPKKIPDLVDLLPPQMILFKSSILEWRDVVRCASHPLIENGKISSQYCDAMIKIIEDYGPYMMLSPGILVLHARPVDGVSDLCLSMLILENGVSFGEQSTTIDIAFVLGAVDDHSHINALFQLNHLLSNEAFVAKLREARNPTDVLRAIWTFTTFELKGSNPVPEEISPN